MLFKRQLLVEKKTIINGLSRKYFLADVDKEKAKNLVVFLHGLLVRRSAKKNINSVYQDIAAKLQRDDVLLVFPLGNVERGKLLGWWPNCKADSLLFIEILIKEIKTEFPNIHNVICAGFSNGAYMCASMIQLHDLDYIDGYCLQGGGHVEKSEDKTNGKKIVLEIGKNDFHHLDTVRELKNTLQSNTTNRLLYRELPCGHTYTAYFVSDNLNFLSSKLS